MYRLYTYARKRALTLWLPLCGFESVEQPVNGRFNSVVVLPSRDIGHVIFPALRGAILPRSGVNALPRLAGLTGNPAHGPEEPPRPHARGGGTAAALTCHPGALQPRHGSRHRGAWPISTRQAHGSAPALWPIVSHPGRPGQARRDAMDGSQRRELGGEPRGDCARGLAATVRWPRAPAD